MFSRKLMSLMFTSACTSRAMAKISMHMAHNIHDTFMYAYAFRFLSPQHTQTRAIIITKIIEKSKNYNANLYKIIKKRQKLKCRTMQNGRFTPWYAYTYNHFLIESLKLLLKIMIEVIANYTNLLFTKLQRQKRAELTREFLFSRFAASVPECKMESETKREQESTDAMQALTSRD